MSDSERVIHPLPLPDSRAKLIANRAVEIREAILKQFLIPRFLLEEPAKRSVDEANERGRG